MHGADNRQFAEIRPPAVRGVMRYWFRALVGGVLSIESLRKAEAEVFGSTESETGQRLLVRVSPQITSTNRSPLLPHKSGKYASESPSIPGGREFAVTLSAVGRVERLPENERLDLASWALWLAIHLGGFGQRARRGGGSLQLLDISPPLGAITEPREITPQSVKALIEGGWRHALGCVQRNFSQSSLRRSKDHDFPMLQKGKVRMIVGNLGVTNEEDARKKVMELRNDVDHPGHRNRAFGGPSPRLASPVHVHLQPGSSGQFIAVVTWFCEPRQGNGSLVEMFLSTIKGRDGVEVAIL